MSNYDYIECGDCLELMRELPNGSIDMILCDLPYGTTRNKWDSVIPFAPLWEQYERIIKENGAILLFSQMPFTAELVKSNEKLFRYEWIVEKTKATGHLNSKKMPLKAHENILVFYKKQPTYNPQMTNGHRPTNFYTKHTSDGSCYGKTLTGVRGGGNTTRFPRDVLQFKWDTQKSSLHPTQKPVALCEYLIKTYSNEGEIILDSCMGSGSTCVACVNTNRHYIGFELDEHYFDIACQRLDEAENKVGA